MTHLFSDLVKPLPKDVIDNCTVWVTTIINTGRFYETRYKHKDKDFLIKYVNDKVAAIDSMRSPRAGTPYKNGEYWAVHLTYYGLD